MTRKTYQKQHFSSNEYGQRECSPWLVRQLIKKRKISSRKTYSLHTPYGQTLFNLQRRVKKVKFNFFQTLSYSERKRYLRLFFFLNTNRLTRFSRFQKKVFFNYHPSPILTQKLQFKKLDFTTFTYHFVKGGLLTSRIPISHRLRPRGRPYYEGGTPDVLEKKIKQKKPLKSRRKKLRSKKRGRLTKIIKLFISCQQKNRSRFYPLIENPLSYKIRKDQLIIHTQIAPEVKSRFSRFWRIFKIYPRSWQHFFITTDFKVNLEKSAYKIVKTINKFKKKKSIEPIIDQPRICYHRRFSSDQLNKHSFFLWRVKYHQLYQSRWRVNFQPIRSIDLIYQRWAWSVKHRGSFIGEREKFLTLKLDRSRLLDLRLKKLYQQLYSLQSLKFKVHSLSRYQQVIHQLPRGRKVRLARRRFFQRRLLRLRRNIENPTTIENYYLGSSKETFAYYRVNRFPVMELNKVIRSKSIFNYFQRESTLRQKIYYERYFFSSFYLYFKKRSPLVLLKGWRRDRQRRKVTKSGQLRMRVLQDHPRWGKYFKEDRQRRFDFLRDNLITRLTRKFNFKKARKVPVSYFKSFFYAQQVDTRRKLDGPQPVDRSLTSFCLAFLSGLVVEKKQKKTFPATAGALFSFNRSTLNLEVLFSPQIKKIASFTTRRRKIQQLTDKIKKVYPPSIYRRLKYFSWFYLFTPLWTIYYWIAKFYCWLLKGSRHLIEDFIDHSLGWFKFYLSLLKLSFSPGAYLLGKIQGLRFVRLMIWVYTSWLHVDMLENDQAEQDYAPYDEYEQQELEAEQEIDPDGDRTEPEDESHTDIGHNYNDVRMMAPTPYFHGSPIWEWYVQNIPDEEIEELFDETNYFVRLVCRPFIDFVVRLPIWSFLELLSLWLEVCKNEYHRTWYKILTYKNTPTKIIGRWWKIPLILTKLFIRLTVWGSFFFWLVNLLQSEDLKILCTYNFGFPWFEEYYYLYVCGCFLASTYLVGPLSLRDFCFKELGFENLLFLFVVPASVSRPEAYQPQRSSFKISHEIQKWDLYYGEKEWPYGHDFLSNRYQNPQLPNKLISYDDIRLVLAQFNEFGYPLGATSYGDYTYVVDLFNRSKPGEDSTYRFSERHPSELRNDWYRRDKFDFHHHFTMAQHIELENNRYKSAESGDQYWNRTIVHRMEYPQNLKASFNRRY